MFVVSKFGAPLTDYVDATYCRIPFSKTTIDYNTVFHRTSNTVILIIGITECC